MVRGDEKAARVEVEGEGLDLGRFGAAAELGEPRPDRVSHTRTSVPRSDAVARPRAVEVEGDAGERRLVRGDERGAGDVEELDAQVAFWRPGQASTHSRESAQSAHSPFGLDTVSIVCSRLRSAKLYT